MLTSRTARWSVGTALLCVALLAVTWLLLVSPRRDEATELRDANLAAQNQNDLLEVKIAQLRAQFAKLPEKQAELADILAQMPADAGMPRLVRDLDTMAATTGATLTSVTPGAAQTLVTDDAAAAQAAAAAHPAGAAQDPAAAAGGAATDTSAVVEIPVTVVVEGDYFQSVAFLKQLQTQMPRAFLVTSVQMSAGSGTEAGSDGQVQVTIGGSVFALPGMSADTVTTGGGTTTGASGATSPMGAATPEPTATPVPTATPAPSGPASPAATPSPSASTSLETT